MKKGMGGVEDVMQDGARMMDGGECDNTATHTFGRLGISRIEGECGVKNMCEVNRMMGEEDDDVVEQAGLDGVSMMGIANLTQGSDVVSNAAGNSVPVDDGIVGGGYGDGHEVHSLFVCLVYLSSTFLSRIYVLYICLAHVVCMSICLALVYLSSTFLSVYLSRIYVLYICLVHVVCLSLSSTCVSVCLSV